MFIINTFLTKNKTKWAVDPLLLLLQADLMMTLNFMPMAKVEWCWTRKPARLAPLPKARTRTVVETTSSQLSRLRVSSSWLCAPGSVRSLSQRITIPLTTLDPTSPTLLSTFTATDALIPNRTSTGTRTVKPST